MRDQNEGMYSDKAVADGWIGWTKKFTDSDVRGADVYPYLSKWIQSKKPKVVVEIGSGSGLCPERIDFSASKYIGIEPSAHLREHAQKTLPDLDFRFGKAEAMPLEDGYANAAFSVFVWLHIADLNAAAKELSRILSPNGSFLIVTANPAAYDVWLGWQKNVRVQGKEAIGDFRELPRHQMFLHSMDEITRSLADNHLEITDTYFCGKGKAGIMTESDFTVIISGYKLA